jgi:DNA invertase Pin-like site-specific DNA recombinase
VQTNSPAKKTRCAIYTRVSTDMQAEKEFNSCAAQEARIRSFIESQEGFEVFKTYSDPGYTGANMERPDLQRLFQDVREKRVDMVITYKIDRLTRSPRDFYQLIELLEANGAGFISVTERFDTSTPAGRLLRNIMLTFAQFERELTSERIKDKFVQLAKKGMFIGGRTPFGYKLENGKLVLDPPRAEAVQMIFNTYAENRSLRAIQRLLKEKGILSTRGNEPTDTFVWHILRKRVYLGMVTHKGAAYPGQHPAIITEELFNHVHALLRAHPLPGMRRRDDAQLHGQDEQVRPPPVPLLPLHEHDPWDVERLFRPGHQRGAVPRQPVSEPAPRIRGRGLSPKPCPRPPESNPFPRFWWSRTGKPGGGVNPQKPQKSPGGIFDHLRAQDRHGKDSGNSPSNPPDQLRQEADFG